jgi:uncharacterized protein (UPF0335 family)
MTEIGKGAKAGAELSGIISEIELVRDRKKQIGDQEKGIFAAAKVKGYDPKTIRRILKIRGEDIKKRQEAEALFDSYMHAIGMAEELPLFRSVESMGVDVTVAEQVVEALSLLVPHAGEILVKVGAARLRLYRDKDGEPHVEEAVEVPPLSPKRSHDPRYDDGEGPVEPTVGPSPRSHRGLSKEAIAAAVARAEARAAERWGMPPTTPPT